MSKIYDTTKFTEDRVYLGEEGAENEVIFVLDYSCPYCKEWVEDVYHRLKEEFIDSGEVKFYTLPQVYLSKETLALTEFTEKVAESYPEHYFDLINSLFENQGADHWGSQEFITEMAEEFKLTGWDDVTLGYDVIRRTRQVTRRFDVEVVPTIYVNGRMVGDRMNYDEISRLIQETGPEPWITDGEGCQEGAGEC